MPRRQQYKVGCRYHDETTVDLNVTIRRLLGMSDYISVQIPSTTSRDEMLAVAVDLAIYVQHAYQVEVSVPYSIRQQFKDAVAQGNVNRTFNRAPIRHEPNVPEPGAREKARALLQALDPDLFQKVERGVAFYMDSPAGNRYIWYPNSRAIVALEPDAPKYVCIHSKDNAVELNTYDWAITMRTYILADEERWRRTANFHYEYSLRGRQSAYNQSDRCGTPGEGERDPGRDPHNQGGAQEGHPRAVLPAEAVRRAEGDPPAGAGAGDPGQIGVDWDFAYEGEG